MNKKIYIFLFTLFLFISACINYNDKKWSKNQEDFLSLNEISTSNIIKRYTLSKKLKLKTADPDYYYPIAIYFFKNIGNSEITRSHIELAIKKETIFQKEALEFLIKQYYHDTFLSTLKTELKEYNEYLAKNNLEFFNSFIYNKGLSEVSQIPAYIESFNPLYELLKSNNTDLLMQENLEKISNYLIKSKIYNYNEKPEDRLTTKLFEIVKWSKFDNFISIVYYYKTKNVQLFLRNVEALFFKNTNITEEKVSAIRDMSIKLGLRKQLYALSNKYKERNQFIRQFYAIDSLHFESFSTQLALLKKIDYLTQINESNYKIRYKKIAYGYKGNTKNWIEDTIDFINDYPDKYYTKTLIDRLFIKCVTENKIELLLSNVDRIKFKNFNSYQRSVLYYHFYLIDTNKEKWSRLLINECPFSYPTLILNNGKVGNTVEKEIKFTDFSPEGQKVAKKIKLLIEFGLIDEAKSISYDNLLDIEKIFINDIFNDYYVKHEDFYTALKFSSKNLILQDNINYSINSVKIIEKAYPVHYRKTIEKYAEKHNVEAALAFAVMREESNFKPNIVSHQNAIGLMQIIPPTARFIAAKLRMKNYNLRNIDDNINMGIFYLKFLKTYHTREEEILSSYNAGPHRTKRWTANYSHYPIEMRYELIPIDETRNYIRKVMQSYYLYDYLLKNQNKIRKFSENINKKTKKEAVQ